MIYPRLLRRFGWRPRWRPVAATRWYMPTMGRAVGIVLAAGRSQRTGFPKALAEIDGVTLVGHVIATFGGAGVNDVVVVVAQPHGGAIRQALSGARIAENPAPERGMLSSLQAGLAEAVAAWPDFSIALFALVDHPHVESATVSQLIDEWRKRGASALRPKYAGRGGHPVLLSRAVTDRVLRAGSETTIRDLIANELEDIDVDDPGVIEDADTREALAALGAKEPRK